MKYTFLDELLEGVKEIYRNFVNYVDRLNMQPAYAGVPEDSLEYISQNDFNSSFWYKFLSRGKCGKEQKKPKKNKKKKDQEESKNIEVINKKKVKIIIHKKGGWKEIHKKRRGSRK